MRHSKVSPREHEVLELIAHEYTSKEIAHKLYISTHTVLSHRKNLYEKLGVRNTAGMIRAAFEKGIMQVNSFFFLIILTFQVNAQDIESVEGAIKLTTFQGLGIAQSTHIKNSEGDLVLDPASGRSVVIESPHDLILPNGNLFIEKGNNLIFASPNGSEVFGISIEDDGGLYFLRNNQSSETALFIDDDETKIGIGTLLPDTELEVRQTATPTLNGANNGISNLSGITIEDTDGSRATMFVDGGDDMTFAFNGIYRAYIDDQTGGYNAVSDIRLKENIKSIKDVLPKILNINPVSYQYRGYQNAKQTLGFIAQEVEPYFPQLVSTKDDIKAINYDGFIVLAIKAIQEQQEEIDKLKSLLISNSK